LSTVPTLHLKHGHLKPLLAGHPWVFATAVERIEGDVKPGDELCVRGPDGRAFGHGYYSPSSAIALRLLTQGEEPADDTLLFKRLESAYAWRQTLLSAPMSEATTAYRLVNSEGDGLGGLIVDVYGPVVCVQFGTVGMHRRKAVIVAALEKLLKPSAIIDKSDGRVAKLEGLPAPTGEVFSGTAPSAAVEVRECGLSVHVEIGPGRGQKTGLYLDQRENRRRFAQFARGKEVLDLFAHVGLFSLHAARGGAKNLTLCDSSEPALQAAQANLERNGVGDADLCLAEWPDAMRDLREKGRRFDLAAVDPPKFATTRDDVSRALGAYKDVNAQVARLLKPGAILFTCSCSSSVSAEDFERAVAAGLAQAGRRGMLLEARGAGSDHPVPPGFAQGRYLKCLILRVD